MGRTYTFTLFCLLVSVCVASPVTSERDPVLSDTNSTEHTKDTVTDIKEDEEVVDAASHRTGNEVIWKRYLIKKTESVTLEWTTPYENETKNKDDVPKHDDQHAMVRAKYVPTAAMKSCALIPDNDKTFANEIDKVLKNEATLIEFKVKFRGKDFPPKTIPGKRESLMFKPFFWVRTTGRFGTNLLLLKPNYDIMSLKSLELEAKKFKQIHLKEYPLRCMDNLTYNDFESVLRELVMNNFQNTSNGLFNSSLTDNVCNLHIRDIGGADFTYYCCHREKNVTMTCSYLESDIWLDLMHLAIAIIKLLFILYCPLLIPERVFRKTNAADGFRYTLEKPKRINITLQEKGHENNKDINKIVLKLSKLKHKQKFKTSVQNLHKNGITKTFEITNVDLKVNANELLNPGEAPVSIVKLLKDYLLHCRVRDLPSTKDCCNAPLCLFSRFGTKWYKCARPFMRVFIALFVTTPWIIRIFIYYKYEHKEMNMRKNAAAEKGYTFPFPGNFVWYVTPIHGIFISVYTLLLGEAVFFRSMLSKKTQEEFIFLFRKCYEDMQTDSRTKAFGVFLQILLLPFELFGILGVLVALVSWIILLPVALLYFAFHMFPTVNLTIRMLVHLIMYTISDKRVSRPSQTQLMTKMKSKLGDRGIARLRGITLTKDKKSFGSVRRRIIQFVVMLLCLLTTYSAILILFELATFFLDLVIYTLIGFILYADHTMSYISLIVLLIMYGKDCFGSVSKRYRRFSSILNRYLMTLCYKDAVSEFYQNAEDQVNKAFIVNPCSLQEDPCQSEKRIWSDPKEVKLGVEKNKLVLHVRKVAFFLTKNDKPKIPTDLFFKACTMTDRYANAPGRPLHNYLRALLNYMFIVAFLFFVFLVVMTFGESGTLSPSNQLLATVAGGVLPFLLKNFLFKRHEGEAIDPDTDINFRVAIHDIVHGYEKTWRVYDIETKEPDLSSELEAVQSENETGYCETITNDNTENDNVNTVELHDSNLDGAISKEDEPKSDQDEMNITFEYDPARIDMYDFEILYKRLHPERKTESQKETHPLCAKADNV